MSREEPVYLVETEMKGEIKELVSSFVYLCTVVLVKNKFCKMT